MRKFNRWVLAMGLVVGLVAGCGVSSKSVNAQLQTQQEKLDSTNYHSTAMMTVSMENGSQTYYIETNYEAPNTYKIALGDANKHINQVIVRNANGMFVVSPALQKVFRFNGDWAQNQGHIYLYDQLLNQIVTEKNVKITKGSGTYTFVLPVSPVNDVVAKQQVIIDSATYEPKKVVLFDKNEKAIVTLEYTSFDTGMKYGSSDFDPQKIATTPDTTAKTTMASTSEFGYIQPNDTLGTKLNLTQPVSATDMLLRYAGDSNSFVLEEWRPEAGTSGVATGELVDLFGVPALYSGSDSSKNHQLTWLSNGVQFSLTSSNLSLDDMKTVALSTFGQVGK